MRRSAMPHESVNVDGIETIYDGLAECLLILPSLSYCDSNPKTEKACLRCREKAESYGLSASSWNAYRSWMRNLFPDEFEKEITPENVRKSYHKFMAYMKEKMPIFNKMTGEFEGYFNRKTKKLEERPRSESLGLDPEARQWFTDEELLSEGVFNTEEQQKAVAWINKNCKFASKI